MFDGLHDRYDALVGAFHRDDKKKIDRHKAENLNQVKSKGIDQSSVDEKLKNIRRNKLTEGLIPKDFEETLS